MCWVSPKSMWLYFILSQQLHVQDEPSSQQIHPCALVALSLSWGQTVAQKDLPGLRSSWPRGREGSSASLPSGEPVTSGLEPAEPQVLTVVSLFLLFLSLLFFKLTAGSQLWSPLCWHCCRRIRRLFLISREYCKPQGREESARREGGGTQPELFNGPGRFASVS